MKTGDPEKRAPELRRLLLRAYDMGKRELPWRGETDPYRVLVSEVMLQQTRVETVIPYYKEWVKRFPDFESLALAEEDEVLRAWQGLGYYSRARNLWNGAKVVRERLGGELPGTASELRDLPGVGEYTAGAVASIAYGEAVPAVDGNVRRVLSRLFDLPDPGAGELREIASALVDPARPGDFNQALMEFGATVCTPRSPACGECSLEGVCQALLLGTVSERPVRKARKPVPEMDVVVMVAVVDDPLRVLLRKRPNKGLLAGMWEFAGVEVPWKGRGERDSGPPPDVGHHLLELETEWGLEVRGQPIPLPGVAHAFTHLKARYWPYLVEVEDQVRGPGLWATLEEIDALPMPVAQGRILEAAVEALTDWWVGEGKEAPTIS